MQCADVDRGDVWEDLRVVGRPNSPREHQAVRESRQLFLLGALGSIETASLLALVDTCSIEASADDRIAKPDVLHATTTHHHHGVFLKLVSFSGNIGSDLHSVREAHTCDLTNSGVRLARGHGCDLGTHATLERRIVGDGTILDVIETTTHRHRLRLRRNMLAITFDELIDCRHR